MSNLSFLLSEWEFASNFAQRLPAEAAERWKSCRSGHSFQAFYGKQIVAYTLEEDQPQVLRVLSCRELKVGIRTGTESTWVDDKTGESIAVSHTPTEIAPHCFMWHLQHTTLDLNEFKGRHNVKFNLALRTANHPSDREAGKVYLLEYVTFKKQCAKG